MNENSNTDYKGLIGTSVCFKVKLCTSMQNKFKCMCKFAQSTFLHWNCNFVGLLDSACLGAFGKSLYNFNFKLLYLAKNHCWGWSTWNAHMVHIVYSIRFKMMYTSIFIFQLLGECHCWWTRVSSMAHEAKFYGRLRLIRGVWEHQKEHGTYVPAQLTKYQLLVHHINTLTKINFKFINVNCLHFIGCQNYTNVLINRVLYQIQVTALLPFFLSILHLLLQLSKIMLWSTVKLLLAIVMSIIFGPLKTLPRSSKSCDCVTFRVFKYLLSTFSTLYTSLPHDLIKAKVLSLVNWCFNRESKSYLCTSLKAGFFSNKKYDLYRCWSCAELCEAFLSSWKTYMCNLMAWYIKK